MISKGNHVKFARFVFLPSVKEQKHEFNFFFVQCIIKQLLDSVFVISRIIKVSVRVISLSLRLRLITLISTLIILDITKTSSNNCLLAGQAPVSGHLSPKPLVAAYENHSRKRPAPVTDIFITCRGYPLTRASTASTFIKNWIIG